MTVDVAGNYRKILCRIEEAAAKSGRDPHAVRLLAAAKSQPIDSIRAAIAAGVRLIGDNYVQEAQQKRAIIGAAVEWHMIGHLQRNKIRLAAEIFDVIESLDSVALARGLEAEGRRRNKTLRAYVEVNLAGEESKSGIAKSGVLELLKTVGDFSHLAVEGLMAVPPFREEAEEARPYFRELCELRLELQRRNLPNIDLKELSMGMTRDYTVAIEEGATIVRIGTALLGPRPL